MAEGQDQNRTEQATPFKLKRAREKGMVARGLDLSFVAGLIGLAAFATIGGAALMALLSVQMRRALGPGVAAAAEPGAATSLAARALWPVLQPVMLFGGTVIEVVLMVEIVQLRGLFFSATPLKPDFTRLNPAKGLKRLFSIRMLKEAAKSVIKMVGYTTIAWLAVRAALAGTAVRITDAPRLAEALDRGAMRLLVLFILAAAAFAILDQIMARGDFTKQMRMSRREVTREHREREGDPRLRAKRKQAHAAFAKQSQGLANLPGSDLMIVNPHHIAVALAYRPAEHAAPMVTALGADRHALQLRGAARRLGIPIVEQRTLARALFRDSDMGREIAAHHYHAVAEQYFRLGWARNA